MPAHLQLPERILLSWSGLHSGPESPRPQEGVEIEANLFPHCGLALTPQWKLCPPLLYHHSPCCPVPSQWAFLHGQCPGPSVSVRPGSPLWALYPGPLVRRVLAEDCFETSSSTLVALALRQHQRVGAGRPGSAVSLSQTRRVAFCSAHVCPGLSGLFLKTYSTSCLYHSFGRLIMTV